MTKPLPEQSSASIPVNAQVAAGAGFSSATQAGPHREGRYVGLFYFLWAGQHGTEGPYDISRILSIDPLAVDNPEHPLWGPLKSFHHWGEPLYGYYLADDAWVLRRHAQLLTLAGVDFLVFDTTNDVTYKNVYMKLLSILAELRLDGWDVPKVAFYTNTNSGGVIDRLYDELYGPGLYEELWFRWKGKPLIIGDPEACGEISRSFFTIRLNQWPNEEQKTNGFPWIEFVRPQRVFYNDEGEKEIVSVSIAQHPSVVLSDTPFYGFGDNWGRNYHDGANDLSADIREGLNFEEQWSFAREQDPAIVFVTGWNEWIAMRFPGPEERPVRFIDQATPMFSRDIEPMKGGYEDAYYIRMIRHIREFKGVIPMPPAAESRTIRIGEGFGQWNEVRTAYRDFTGDTMGRRHGGYGGTVYTDDSGRNDFELLKVARDDSFLYFYARTAEPITPYTDPEWMMLLLRLDREDAGNWEGYHYIVNRTVADSQTTLLEKCRGGWSWETAAQLEYRVSGREMHVAVPVASLGLTQGEPMRLQFKWVDHIQPDCGIMTCYLHGDTAPDGRLNYVYEAGNP